MSISPQIHAQAFELIKRKSYLEKGRNHGDTKHQNTQRFKPFFARGILVLISFTAHGEIGDQNDECRNKVE